MLDRLLDRRAVAKQPEGQIDQVGSGLPVVARCSPLSDELLVELESAADQLEAGQRDLIDHAALDSRPVGIRLELFASAYYVLERSCSGFCRRDEVGPRDCDSATRRSAGGRRLGSRRFGGLLRLRGREPAGVAG